MGKLAPGRPPIPDALPYWEAWNAWCYYRAARTDDREKYRAGYLQHERTRKRQAKLAREQREQAAA